MSIKDLSDNKHQEIVALLEQTNLNYKEIEDRIGGISYPVIAKMGLEHRSKEKRKLIQRRVLGENRKGHYKEALVVMNAKNALSEKGSLDKEVNQDYPLTNVMKMHRSDNKSGIVTQQSVQPALTREVTQFTLKGKASNWDDLIKRIQKGINVVDKDKLINFSFELFQKN